MSFKIIQLTAKCLVQAKHEVYLMSIQTCKPLSKLINKSSFIYWMNKLSHKTDNYIHCRYTQLFSQFFVGIPNYVLDEMSHPWLYYQQNRRGLLVAKHDVHFVAIYNTMEDKWMIKILQWWLFYSNISRWGTTISWMNDVSSKGSKWAAIPNSMPLKILSNPLKKSKPSQVILDK